MKEIDTWMVRLMDAKHAALISSLNTNEPDKYLKVAKFCEENDMPLHIPSTDSLDDNDYFKKQYGDIEQGTIVGIDVSFGGHGNLNVINIWLDNLI